VKFNSKNSFDKSGKKTEKTLVTKLVKFSDIPCLVLPRLIKVELNKPKYHETNSKKSQNQTNNKERHTYVQASSPNIKDILKIKENFYNLSLKKIEEIHKTINKSSKMKSCINMTTKGLSHRQIIVPIGNNNIDKFISSSIKHVANINRARKNIKSDTIANFIHDDYCGLIIISNKIAS